MKSITDGQDIIWPGVADEIPVFLGGGWGGEGTESDVRKGRRNGGKIGGRAAPLYMGGEDKMPSELS